MKPKIFAIIPSFNSADEIINCLSSLRRNGNSSFDLEIIVIDNASADKTAEMIGKKFPDVEIIRNSQNLGFARAVNIGIKIALKENASHVLLLNQDTIVEPQLIGKLLNENSGLVAPVIKFERDKKIVYDHGGIVNWWIGRTIHREFPKIMQGLVNIDYVSFCCVLIKKEVFDKIGLLNESYFLYFEDVDFCTKVKKSGLGISISKDAIITHNLREHRSIPFGERSAFKTKELLKSNRIFVNTCLPWYRKPLGLAYLALLFIKGEINKAIRNTNE